MSGTLLYAWLMRPPWHWRGYAADTRLPLKTLSSQTHTHKHTCIDYLPFFLFLTHKPLSLNFFLSSLFPKPFSHLTAILTQICRSNHKKIPQKKCPKTLTSPQRGGNGRREKVDVWRERYQVSFHLQSATICLDHFFFLTLSEIMVWKVYLTRSYNLSLPCKVK